MIWELFWGLFLVSFFLVFLIPEAIAIIRKEKGDTLSENIRKWLNKPWKRWAFGIGWILFIVWFIPHILYGL